MSKRTEERILNKIFPLIEQILKGDYYSTPSELKVEIWGSDVHIKTARACEAVKLTFSQLQQLSNLLGTEKINLKDGNSTQGCESCDYGSSYEVDICCSDCNLEVFES